MNRNVLTVSWSVLAAAGLLLAGCAGDSGDSASSAAMESAEASTPPAQEEMAGGGSGSGVFTGTDTLWNHSGDLGAPVATFGKDASKWTETTLKAANRGTTGKPATVVGEVVDVSCYMQLGKRGEAHVPCGTNCVQNGAPIGVVDADNNLYVVMAEEHDPRRYGNVALKEAMLPYMAKTVQVEGMLTEREGVKTLFVLGYTVGDDPNQPAKN